jgi:multisubunit Na+/H+ antiporter MnhB subunit
MTATARRVRTVVLIAAVGFLLAFLIPRSHCVSVFESFTQHRVKLAGVLKSRSDILVPIRALVQMSIVILCGIAANLVALLGGKGEPD